MRTNGNERAISALVPVVIFMGMKGTNHLPAGVLGEPLDCTEDISVVLLRPLIRSVPHVLNETHHKINKSIKCHKFVLISDLQDAFELPGKEARADANISTAVVSCIQVVVFVDQEFLDRLAVPIWTPWQKDLEI